MSVAPVLVHYDITKQLKVYCDASPRGVGACLMQVMNGHERPVAYASRTLTSANTPTVEISSPATDPEGLQQTEPARSQDITSQQPLRKSIRQIKRPRRLVEEMN